MLVSDIVLERALCHRRPQRLSYKDRRCLALKVRKIAGIYETDLYIFSFLSQLEPPSMLRTR